MILWCVSGLYMTAVSIDKVHGDHLVKKQSPLALSSFEVKSLDAISLSELCPINHIALRQINGRVYYQIDGHAGTQYIDATNLQPLEPTNEAQIRATAKQYFTGDASIVSTQRLARYPRELGGREQPIWRVEFDDWLHSTLYFTVDSGELRSKRSDLWRWYDFLWMFHIMDYDERENIHGNLLRIFSGAGLLLGLCGVGLLFYSFRHPKAKQSSTLGGLKRIHRWVGLLLGVQLVLWTLSGLSFSLLSDKQVGGRFLVQSVEKQPLTVAPQRIAELVKAYPQAQYIESDELLGQTVFRLKDEHSSWLVDENLTPLAIDRHRAQQIIAAVYRGKGELKSLTPQREISTESRQFPLPLWRAEFDDDTQTHLYLSAESGAVLGVRTDSWRLRDWLWMLHTMDYQGRDDINNPLVVLSASLALFIALSGLLMLRWSFNAKDFNLIARLRRVPLLVQAEDGFNSEIFAPGGANLFDVLQRSGFALPSSCGGGGDCGLCRVQVDDGTSPGEADKRLINPAELAQGYRLACQLRLQQGCRVTLPSSVAAQQLLHCRVTKSEWLTPTIKGITLALPDEVNFKFAAGEYLLVHIPAGRTQLCELTPPPRFLRQWQTLQIANYTSHSEQMLTRAYSMANAPAEGQHLILNVRLALPNSGNPELPCGRASSYLCAASVGDIVTISGPFGHFHARPGDRPMVLVGGGAGMAPLRSHLLHQLGQKRSRRKIRFYFGARNQDEIFYAEEFEQLAQSHDNFHWQVALSHLAEDDPWEGFRGMVHQLLQTDFLDRQAEPNSCDYYLCGPGAMNQACIELLMSRGVARESILVDDFGN